MIANNRMRFVKTKNDINYYVFKPSLFSLYYNDGQVHSSEPSHLKSLSHKLHMMMYIFGGGTEYFMQKKTEKFYLISCLLRQIKK